VIKKRGRGGGGHFEELLEGRRGQDPRQKLLGDSKRKSFRFEAFKRAVTWGKSGTVKRRKQGIKRSGGTRAKKRTREKKKEKSEPWDSIYTAESDCRRALGKKRAALGFDTEGRNKRKGGKIAISSQSAMGGRKFTYDMKN